MNKYPEHDDNVKRVTSFLKRAQKHCKKAKNDLITVGDDQRELLESEQEVLDMKIGQICDAIDLQKEDDVAEIESFVRHAEAFVSEYFEFVWKIKTLAER